MPKWPLLGPKWDRLCDSAAVCTHLRESFQSVQALIDVCAALGQSSGGTVWHPSGGDL